MEKFDEYLCSEIYLHNITCIIYICLYVRVQPFRSGRDHCQCTVIYCLVVFVLFRPRIAKDLRDGKSLNEIVRNAKPKRCN